MVILPPTFFMKLFLTGLPGVGKTTIVQQLIKLLREDGYACVGFVTEEERDQQGDRVGFLMRNVAHAARTAYMAHVSEAKVNTGVKHRRYHVNVDGIRDLAAASLSEPGDVIVLDEVGRMELYCPEFVLAAKRVILEDPRVLVLGTIALYGKGIIAEIKKHVDLVLVTEENRDTLTAELFAKLKNSLQKE